MRRPFLSLLLLGLVPTVAAAAPGDTTWVNTFQQHFINWATPHYATYSFPDDPGVFEKATIHLTIECPVAPDDCDPWDRLGHLRIVTPDQGNVEIARFITPYDITGGTFPGSCTWTHNVTRYLPLLQDDVEFRLYIESWIGGNDGWLVTLDFEMIEGTGLDPMPYRVVNLWGDDHVEYGNPDDPFSDHIQPTTLEVPADALLSRVYMYVTGHGQGNTGNCAEFCSRTHTLVADGTPFSHALWRSNCFLNACSPQGGTWSLSRAGWCPGDAARAWTVDVTSAVTPGTTASLDYQVQAYINLCRPGNVNCVNGVTCPDCNYNVTGHTIPHYTVQGNAVFWKPRNEVVSAEPTSLPAAAGTPLLGQNVPNPFSPSTRFAYTVARPGPAEITVHDAAGRVVLHESREHVTSGTYHFRWNGRDEAGMPVAAGVYFYSVRVNGESETRKMVHVK